MTFNLSELIVFSTVIVVVALLAINNIRIFVNNRNLMNALVQSSLDKISLQNALDRVTNELELMSMQETDGFVKFLSESRESAFTYIEEVQASIKGLAQAMSEADDIKISKAYADLIRHMPKEEPND